ADVDQFTARKLVQHEIAAEVARRAGGRRCAGDLHRDPGRAVAVEGEAPNAVELLLRARAEIDEPELVLRGRGAARAVRPGRGTTTTSAAATAACTAAVRIRRRRRCRRIDGVGEPA